jgi:UDPglucose 6-dehydrogenase
MGVESAELVKHGVNAFLALSVSFANELAGIGERLGADAAEVERGLKSEGRIGARAYLRPGAAFAGGTLARDLDYLTQIGERERVPMRLLRAVRASNDEHKQWARRTIESLVGGEDGRLDGHLIGIWGLVYKQGTDTLRRSNAVELCRELARAGAVVKAHDSAVRVVPDDLSGVFTLCPTPLEAAEGSSALVVETDWPSYQEVEPERLVAAMRSPIVVDANGFLLERLGNVSGLRYVAVGGNPA